MIKINLLGVETIADNSKYLVLVGYVASMLIALVTCYSLYAVASSEIASLTDERDRLQTELAKLQTTTKEVRELEKKKKDLADKLVVIARLKKSKIGPVHVLDDLNIAVPEKSWVTEVKETSGLMKITGFALDNQTISGFMRELEKSDYFPQVDLVETTQADKQGVKIYAYVIQAKVSYAGKIKAAEPEVTKAKNADKKSAAVPAKAAKDDEGA